MSALLFALAQMGAGHSPSTGGYLRGGYSAILVILALYGLYLWHRHTIITRRNKRGR